jgi:dTDP-4-dehydrorhamnose 3,5-epimerase-like enzyme
MPQLLTLQTFTSEKGSLTVFEKILQGDIKRVFYIYGVKDEVRGGHRQKIAKNALTCLYGSCKVYVNNGKEEQFFELDSPNKCLILEPEDWHQISNFSDNAVLLVLSDQYFDKDDFINEPY